MTKNSNDEIIRAYATLSSLRINIEKITMQDIQETYINEYHHALDKLSSIGIDTSEFHIPESEIYPIREDTPVFTYGERGNSSAIYSKEKYVKKQYFLMKIDAVLGYFEIISSPEKKTMGFNTHKD